MATLPLQKLQQYILSTVRVTEAEIRDAYARENNRVNARYIFFDPESISLENIFVTDAEMNRYYKENEEDFRNGKPVAMGYISDFDSKIKKGDSVFFTIDGGIVGIGSSEIDFSDSGKSKPRVAKIDRVILK